MDQLLSYGEVNYDSNGDKIGTITTHKTYIHDDQGKNQGNPERINNFKFEGILYEYAILEYSGRKLTKIKVYDLLNILQHEIEYTYNDQGHRTSKTIDGVTTYYTLSGNKVLYETNNIYGIIYTYDVDGSLIGFSYDDNINDGTSYEDYFYARNLQGDISKILKVSGSEKIILVEYEYDAWGKLIKTDYSTAGEELFNINPYTYRGYRYDKEIDLYYLNSRFYDANIGRFLNADGLLGQQGNILGHNMFAYTENNPVMYTDISGYAPEFINVLELVGVAVISVSAIVIGVFALATATIVAPLVAVLLICAGASVLLNMAVIGRAQYNHSISDGRSGSSLYDDVVDSVGSNSMDRVLYHTATKMMFDIADKGIGSGVALLLVSKNPVNIVSYSKVYSKVSYLPFVFLGITSYKTTRAYTDENYSYEYARRLGWSPWED